MTTRPEWASLRFHVRQGTAIVRVQRTRIDVEFFEDTHPAELLAGMALKRKGANNVVGRYETMNSDDGGDDVQGRYEAGRRRYGNGPIAWQYLVVGHPSLAVSVNCFQELP